MEDPSADWRVQTAAGGLRRWVDHYTGYRLSGFAPGIHRGLPSTHLTLIVAIGGPIEVLVDADPTASPGEYRCVVGGLQASTALIADPGFQEGVAIALTPLGSRAVLGRPARELWNASHELHDIVGPIGRELWERLQPTASWDDRFAVCDEVLGRIAVDAEPSAELQTAWRMIVGSAGTTRIGTVAREVGWSNQHLGRRFRDEFGLSPKLAARIARFDHARELLQARAVADAAGSDAGSGLASSSGSALGWSLAMVAARAGYADQGHMNRDFRGLADCTPVELIRDEVHFVQDPQPVSS